MRRNKSPLSGMRGDITTDPEEILKIIMSNLWITDVQIHREPVNNLDSKAPHQSQWIRISVLMGGRGKASVLCFLVNNSDNWCKLRPKVHCLRVGRVSLSQALWLDKKGKKKEVMFNWLMGGV